MAGKFRIFAIRTRMGCRYRLADGSRTFLPDGWAYIVQFPSGIKTRIFRTWEEAMRKVNEFLFLRSLGMQFDAQRLVKVQ